MLQVTLACFGCLTLIWVSEAQYERAIRYWCQGTFAATVTLPMLARRYVKAGMPRGPRRDWWKKTCEAIFFSFLTLLLVSAGGLLQGAVYTAASAISAGGTPAAVPTPVMPPLPVLPGPPPGSTTEAPKVGSNYRSDGMTCHCSAHLTPITASKAGLGLPLRSNSSGYSACFQGKSLSQLRPS